MPRAAEVRSQKSEELAKWPSCSLWGGPPGPRGTPWSRSRCVGTSGLFTLPAALVNFASPSEPRISRHPALYPSPYSDFWLLTPNFLKWGRPPGLRPSPLAGPADRRSASGAASQAARGLQAPLFRNPQSAECLNRPGANVESPGSRGSPTSRKTEVRIAPHPSPYSDFWLLTPDFLTSTTLLSMLALQAPTGSQSAR